MAPQPTQAARVRRTDDQVAVALRSALEGSRGGVNRRLLLRTLDERPRNANRLAEALGLDYKTVRYHLSVLEEAGAVTRAGDDYGAVYVPTARVRDRWQLVETTPDGAP